VLSDDSGCVWRPADDPESGERTPLVQGVQALGLAVLAGDCARLCLVA
jgi:hypothetical protein